VTAVHLCRGNGLGAWLAAGGYDPIAEQVFGLHCDRLLLEYDTERAGTFEPLRLVRPDRVVVLGLVSTKTPVLESADDLLRRIDDAARYVPVERLVLSPQCGFASHFPGQSAERGRPVAQAGAGRVGGTTGLGRCGSARLTPRPRFVTTPGATSTVRPGTTAGGW
jgi:Cobalamin-independent synthase, Catalytic domain